jgi:hypothetical protein
MDSVSNRAYPLLIDALRLLPVQPFREREELGLARHQAAQVGFSEVRGVRLRATQLNELFVEDGRGAPRISPLGADVLLELLRGGALDRTEQRVEGGIELLEAYAQGRASIVGHSYWKKSRPRRVMQSVPARRTTPVADTGTVSSPYVTRYRVITHRLT